MWHSGACMYYAELSVLLSFYHAANTLRMISERSREDWWLTVLSARFFDVHFSVSSAGFAVDSLGLESRSSPDNLKVAGGRAGEELDLTGLSFLDLQVDFVIGLAHLGFLGPDQVCTKT